MLTRPLMRQRITDGTLRPLFVDASAKALLTLAAELLACAQDGLGRPREEVEESLAAIAGAARQPVVARGLVKLLVDRMTFAEPAPETIAQRTRWVEAALEVRRELDEAATVEDFEVALTGRLGQPLDEVRGVLFADLPQTRPLLAFDPLAPADLLQRYNLALAQTPLLGARRLTLRAHAPELLRVRRLLRWLRFCRLVAEVRREDDDWVLVVEGPGAVLSLHKKYGLQLASFLAGVPGLGRWTLEAELESRGRHARLALSDADPLVSPLPSAVGWLPPALRSLAADFEGDPEWEVDLLPLPRHTGTRGLCVPDLTLRARDGGREFAVELFHPWHAGALGRRLEELQVRPDPQLVLGVDRALVRAPELKARLEARPDVFLFNAYPSARALRRALER